MGEVFVVDERAEEVALEVDVIEGGISDPEAAKGEVDDSAGLGWIGGGVGLGVVEDEPVLAVSLGEDHAVRHGGGEVGKLSLDEGGSVCQHNYYYNLFT